jgi:membrane fusion protein, multidrug efflux system
MAAMQRRESFLVFYIAAFVVVTLAGAAVYWFWQGKQQTHDQDAKARAAQLQAGPTVNVGQSVRGPSVRRINLTGELRPYMVTTLYSRIGGYLSRINVDVGDKVRAGQFIAEVQAPELESDYRSAVAEFENRQRVFDRTRDLASKGFFSQQALDNAQTDVQTARAKVETLRSQLAYRSLYAPFAGVVTARFVDTGALITNAANNQTSSQPVVTISDASRLRVNVYVEQVDAPYVKPGTEAELADATDPGRKVKAKVSRMTGELDPKTRTLLAEIDFDNHEVGFIPGAFVNVSLLIGQTSYIEVPASALVVRERKNYVAVIGADDHIKLTPIEIAGTDGASLRIVSGIGEAVRVALSLPNTVADGAKVSPAQAPASPTPAASVSPPAAQPGAAGNPPSK